MLGAMSRRRDVTPLEGVVYLNTAAEGIPTPAVAERWPPMRARCSWGWTAGVAP